MKIAVYTIAKNEEQFVERWAKSCEEADYRFILDTGSTDKTVELARSAGVEVAVASISPWRFDDARNVSLALLPDDIDICIALDMDEVLVDGWRQEIEKIKPETTRPRYQYTWSWSENGSPGLQYGGDKIHRRHGYRWKHPVHEVITTDRIIEVQEWIGLEIHHFPDNSKSRGQYLPLLKLSTVEDPEDDRNAFYYARELYFKGRYAEASEEFIRHLSLKKAIWAPERAASMRYLAKIQPQKREEWLIKAHMESPNRRESLVELAQHLYELKSWGPCLSFAEKALEIETKPMDYLCEEFAWGYLPWDLAAISSYYLKDYASAKFYGEKALELSPDNQRLIKNLEFYSEEVS